MNADRVRDVLRGSRAGIDDLGRLRVWRGVDRRLSAPPRPSRRRWLGIAAALLAAVVLFGGGVWFGSRPASVEVVHEVDLVAAVDRPAHYQRRGIQLTLLGPGSAHVTDPDRGLMRVRLIDGVLVGSRTEDAAELAVQVDATTRRVVDHAFTIRAPEVAIVASAEIVPTQPERGEVLLVPPAPAAPRRKARTPAIPPPVETGEPADPLGDAYREAEAAIRRGDQRAAADLLESIIRDAPGATLADAARYDLALLAYRRGDHATALHFANIVITSGREPALQAAAQRLRALLVSARRE